MLLPLAGLLSYIYFSGIGQRILDNASKVISIGAGSTILYNNWIKGEGSNPSNSDNDNKDDKKSDDKKSDDNKDDKKSDDNKDDSKSNDNKDDSKSDDNKDKSNDGKK